MTTLIERLKEKLGDAEPAPRVAKMSTADKQSLIAAEVLRAIIRSKTAPSLAAIMELVNENTPLDYQRANALGTILGAGVGGEGGLDLYRENKAIARTCKNVRLLLNAIKPDDLDAMLQQEGMDEEALKEFLDSLP